LLVNKILLLQPQNEIKNMMVATHKKKLVQHNFLVQSRFNCSYLEYKILVVLISQIDSLSDRELPEYQIPVSLITDIDSGSAYENVRCACERLLSMPIFIEKISLESSKNQEFVGLNPLQKCEYKKGTGYIIAQLNPELKPYLLNLTKNFTKVDMEDLLKMDSFYSGRLYVLFKQYVMIGKRSFSMDEIKDMFLLRETKSMAKYKNINKFILKPMEQELLKTNLVVKRLDSQTIMNGKTVERVVYSINKKHETVTEATRLDYVIESPLNEEWEKKLYNIGIKIPAIQEIKKALDKKDIDVGYINHVINELGKKHIAGKIYELAGAVYDCLMIKRYLFAEYKNPRPKQAEFNACVATPSTTAATDAVVQSHPLYRICVNAGLSDWQIRDICKRVDDKHPQITNAKAWIQWDAKGDTPKKYALSVYSLLCDRLLPQKR
jgi:hypothetical protein